MRERGHGGGVDRPEQRATRHRGQRARSARHAMLVFFLTLLITILASVSGQVQAAPKTPNILFVIMDDVGIDQMRAFGYGGGTPPATPNIDTIANAGVRFHNTWSMPACSTSRSVFFAGRYPFRTNVFSALGPSDLANSQVSPFEMTTPKLLKMKGYQSALFGKFHLGLQANNPFLYAMPKSLGWDFFFGWLDETGDPSSIDTTAGGVAPAGTYSCGFVRGAANGGADIGACYAANDTCEVMTNVGSMPPGRTCRDNGGIFDPNKTCQSPRPAYINFSTLSAHYVSPLVINREDGSAEQVPPTDIRARTYRGTVPVDAAIAWINSRPKDTPWMASLSFASAHTPLMQPPPALLPDGSDDTNAFDCANTDQQRVLSNQMIEALDTEVGRLLVDTGLARRGQDGRLNYDPHKSDTMIVLVGDNGTLGFVVKEPFDATRAKGTAYQTGVWVPLLVAGPLVKQPDREVKEMVNIADLFQLFGEIADIDVRKSVPRTLDSVPMLPYLTNPNQRALRKTNFTQVGPNLQANGGFNGPCTFTSTCSQIPPTIGVCEDNAGTWWGPGATALITAGIPPEGLKYCCNVNRFLAGTGQSFSPEPLSSIAIRNKHFKLVSNFTQTNDPTTNDCVPTQTAELYLLDEVVPKPRLDKVDMDLLQKSHLTPKERKNYRKLTKQLAALLDSQPPCPGDGNIDGVVNGKDLADWNTYALLSQGKSSWYDFNLDGLTDSTDLAVVQQNLGMKCKK
jgi:arylsulfatase A-like enzyme